MPRSLLAVDAPSCCLPGVFALPKSITTRGRRSTHCGLQTSSFGRGAPRPRAVVLCDGARPPRTGPPCIRATSRRRRSPPIRAPVRVGAGVFRAFGWGGCTPTTSRRRPLARWPSSSGPRRPRAPLHGGPRHFPVHVNGATSVLIPARQGGPSSSSRRVKAGTAIDPPGPGPLRPARRPVRRVPERRASARRPPPIAARARRPRTAIASRGQRTGVAAALRRQASSCGRFADRDAAAARGGGPRMDRRIRGPRARAQRGMRRLPGASGGGRGLTSVLSSPQTPDG